MKVYCVVLFQCFLFALSNGAADTAPRPALINIGALFNFNSTIGKVAKIAIQEAVDDIYSNSSILNGYTLNITLKESVCNGFLGFVQAIQLMQKEVVAIIGPQSSAVTHMVSLVATELQIPLLSFAATDPTIKP
ncbi:Glutamate receptor 3.3 [Bienertia sinuspersici]